MPNATVSLNTTSFAVTVEPSDQIITFADTTNLSSTNATQLCVYVDNELIRLVRPTTGSQWAVRRGIGGTAASRHATNVVVWIGRADQFYDTDPIGLPLNEIAVYPYINVLNGSIWVPEGDETASGLQARIWSKVTRSIDPGALGINQLVVNTPS